MKQILTDPRGLPHDHKDTHFIGGIHLSSRMSRILLMLKSTFLRSLPY